MGPPGVRGGPHRTAARAARGALAAHLRHPQGPPPRPLAAVRELWLARDALAAERDIAPGRVLPDAAIVDAAVRNPDSPQALAELPVFRGRSQRRLARYWFDALRRAAELPESELPRGAATTDGPRRCHAGPTGTPTPPPGSPPPARH